MNSTRFIVTLGALSLVLGVALNEPVEATVKMSKQPGIISMQDAIKAATRTIGDYVISTDLFTDKGGVSYYRITVVGPANEVKDVYVGSKSGKVRQVIEHPDEMPPRLLRVEWARTMPLHCSSNISIKTGFCMA
ncbi:MAG: hypothetical protein ABI618_08615 [Nitrospirota bacterium]